MRWCLFGASSVAISVRLVRLLVARCEVSYTGRLEAHLPEAVRLIMIKADGSVLVHADSGGYKPLNWMTPPTAVERCGDRLVVRRHGGGDADRLEIRLVEVLVDAEHELELEAELAKQGAERELQELLAADPGRVEPGLRLVRREAPTDVGPVDLLCRDVAGRPVAVEVKRVAGLPAVEQLTRYLELLRARPETARCRGILCAEQLKPQAERLARERGLGCVRVDPAVLRGEREPELVLFAA